MLRILPLLIALSLVEGKFWNSGFPFSRRNSYGQWYRNHKRYESRSNEDTSEEPSSESNLEDILDNVASKLVNVDQQLNRICQGNRNVLEEYQDGIYRRILSIKGYSNDTVCVQIKHKLMLTTAKAINNNLPDLQDVKVLAGGLLNENAFYIIEFDKVTINIPFQSEGIFDRGTGCSRHVNKRLFTVPQKSPSESYHLMDVRTAYSVDESALEFKVPPSIDESALELKVPLSVDESALELKFPPK